MERGALTQIHSPAAAAESLSRVRLRATPQSAAHQAPPSLGFSRQEHWSALPFPSPMHESESEREVAQSCPILCDPMDCSLPGSSIHGIFQQEYWAGVLFPSPGDLPDSGIKLHLLLGRQTLYQGATREAHIKQSTMQNCVLSLHNFHSLPGNRFLRVILIM